MPIVGPQSFIDRISQYRRVELTRGLSGCALDCSAAQHFFELPGEATVNCTYSNSMSVTFSRRAAVQSVQSIVSAAYVVGSSS